MPVEVNDDFIWGEKASYLLCMMFDRPLRPFFEGFFQNNPKGV
jgi:hypothetical protein